MMPGDVSRPAVRADHSSHSRNRVITVAGIGNEFRGDDAAGILITRRIRRDIQSEVNIVEIGDDQLALLEVLRTSDVIIIADAVRAAAIPGTVFRIDAGRESLPANLFPVSSHAISCAEAIELARTLGFLPSIVLVYGIVGKDFTHGTGPTPEVAEAIEAVGSGIESDVSAILARQAEPDRMH